MRLKNYTAPTMPEVMSLIRHELGPDAIIVSHIQRQNSVCVTAAVEQKIIEPEVSKQEFQFLNILNQLMQMIESQKLPQDLIEILLSRISACKAANGINDLVERVFFANNSTCGWTEKLKPGRSFMLVGPTGAGKTLTAAKLALECVHFTKNIAIVSLDAGKSGAHQQLESFAHALNVPFQMAEDIHVFSNSASLYHDKCLLIDTTGLNALDPKDIERLSTIQQNMSAEPILILPAGLDTYETLDLISEMNVLNLSHVIHTKVDSCRRFATLMAILSQNHLNLSAFGNSPSLASRLMPARGHYILELLKRESAKIGHGSMLCNSLSMPTHKL